MSTLTVYHCSPDKILNFNFESGVHFGGIHSAFEAGYRKLSMLQRRYGVEQEIVYLHVCSLNVSDIYDSLDVGSYSEWLKEARRARDKGYDVLRYKNEYEPDTYPSYYVLNKELINVRCIEEISIEEVLDTLEEVGTHYLFNFA